MTGPDQRGYSETPNKAIGFLLMTRADHLRMGSTPPIDPKFGDNVCHGDTLSNEELLNYYTRKINGTKKMLSLPPETVENFRKDTQFLDPEWFGADLEYCRQRGVNVSDGEKLLDELKKLK